MKTRDQIHDEITALLRARTQHQRAIVAKQREIAEIEAHIGELVTELQGLPPFPPKGI